MLINAELFAVGTWNGITFRSADLDMMVTSFETLGLADRVPLKLGHDGNDPRVDPFDQLSLGWVKRVYREGDTLMGELDVTDAVAEMIKAGHLRFVSVELLQDVKAGTRVIPWVLDAVALLGSDQPAVGILEALSNSLMKDRAEFTFASRVVFTLKGERDQMEMEQKAVKLTFDLAIANGRINPATRQQFTARHGTRGTVAEAEAFIATAPRPNDSGRIVSAGPSSRAPHANAGAALKEFTEE